MKYVVMSEEFLEGDLKTGNPDLPIFYNLKEVTHELDSWYNTDVFADLNTIEEINSELYEFAMDGEILTVVYELRF